VYAKWWIRARVREYAFENRNLVRLPSTRNGRVTRARLGTMERKLAQKLGRAPTRTELAEALEVTENDVAYVSAALSSYDMSLTHEPTERGFEPCDEHPSPESLLATLESQRVLSARVQSAVATLEDRDRMIIRAHFLTDEDVSLADLGETLGVTRQRVSQIVSRVRKQLRKELRAIAS
jgi:RNA polymerase sigma-32 factor